MPSSQKTTWLIVTSALIVTLLVVYALVRDTATGVPAAEITKLLDDGNVTRVIRTDGYDYFVTPQKLYKTAAGIISAERYRELVVEHRSGTPLVLWLLGGVALLGLLSIWGRYWMKHRAAPAAGAPHAYAHERPESPIEPSRSDVTMADVGGIRDVKEELEEIIDFLRHPQKYRRFGARLPRGVLLIGPPGVGKTMIAKAVAAEADVPFYYHSGSSFVHIYVGMGAKRVQQLFGTAAKNAPAIIFIDEIDAVGKMRDGVSNDEREATLNQLLTEMDGFTDTGGIIVIGATNKIEMLDPALLRAGRFDRRIYVDLPTPDERSLILEKYLQAVPHAVDVAQITAQTVGFSGAGLAALVNEAALHTLRRGGTQVESDDVMQVRDKVAFGKRRIPVMNERQKQCRAVYLAGKAVTAVWYDLAFEKVMLGSESIRPALGDAMMHHEIEAQIRMLLAGKIACHLRFDEHTSAAADDLAQARRLAEAMLFEYGMGNTLLPTSDELTTLLLRLEKETRALLSSKTAALESVEAMLLEFESVDRERIRREIDAVL